MPVAAVTTSAGKLFEEESLAMELTSSWDIELIRG